MSFFRKLKDRLIKGEENTSPQPNPIITPPESLPDQAPLRVAPAQPRTIEVPDPWRESGTGPFILEENPDIHAILSDPNPMPPKPAEIWNQYYQHPPESTRNSLAMAYMRHPSAEVREATIRFVGSKPRKELRIGAVLAQRLTVESSEALRRMAAEAIWKRGNEELVETMKYLAGNDEAPGDDGNGAFVSQRQVRVALQTLFDANRSGEGDFQKALLFAWCWHDEELAGSGKRLVDLWLSKRTFLNDETRPTAREVGIEVHKTGGIKAMEMMFRPVTLLAGSDAAAELSHAWSGIGSWQP
jgi:hypothetical protein